jgi:uncharacterized protein YoxC
MPVAAAWILVALVAVLVAFAVPALWQLRKTLRAAEQTLETTGKRVNEALDGLTVTLARVNRAAEELENGMGRVSNLLTALGGIGDAIVRFRSSFGTIASLGSILSGGVMAALGFARRRRRDPEPQEREDAKK